MHVFASLMWVELLWRPSYQRSWWKTCQNILNKSFCFMVFPKVSLPMVLEAEGRCVMKSGIEAEKHQWVEWNESRFLCSRKRFLQIERLQLDVEFVINLKTSKSHHGFRLFIYFFVNFVIESVFYGSNLILCKIMLQVQFHATTTSFMCIILRAVGCSNLKPTWILSYWRTQFD